MRAAKKVVEHKANGKSSAKLFAGPLPAVETFGGNGHATVREEKAALEKWTLKQEKNAEKAEKKAPKKAQKKAQKNGKMAAKPSGSPCPIIELIDEQVRTNIPEKLVAKVKKAKNKKYIISSNYPYPKTMKDKEYLKKVELLQI